MAHHQYFIKNGCCGINAYQRSTIEINRFTRANLICAPMRYPVVHLPNYMKFLWPISNSNSLTFLEFLWFFLFRIDHQKYILFHWFVDMKNKLYVLEMSSRFSCQMMILTSKHGFIKSFQDLKLHEHLVSDQCAFSGHNFPKVLIDIQATVRQPRYFPGLV